MFINVFISAYYIYFKRFFGRQNGRFYGRFDSSIVAAIADGVSSCESGQEASGTGVIGFLEDCFSTAESSQVFRALPANSSGWGVATS